MERSSRPPRLPMEKEATSRLLRIASTTSTKILISEHSREGCQRAGRNPNGLHVSLLPFSRRSVRSTLQDGQEKMIGTLEPIHSYALYIVLFIIRTLGPSIRAGSNRLEGSVAWGRWAGWKCHLWALARPSRWSGKPKAALIWGRYSVQL